MHLHDHAAAGGIAPVVGILQAQDDVLLLLHLVAHHVLNLLRALLQAAVAPARRGRNQPCITASGSLSTSLHPLICVFRQGLHHRLHHPWEQAPADMDMGAAQCR